MAMSSIPIRASLRTSLAVSLRSCAVSCGKPRTKKQVMLRSFLTEADTASSRLSVFIFFLISLRVSSEPLSGA